MKYGKDLQKQIYRDSRLGYNGDFIFDEIIPKINSICKQLNSPHINKLWHALDTVRENDMKNEWSSFEGLPWNRCPYQNNDCDLYFDNNDTATIVDISTRYILETLVNQIL